MKAPLFLVALLASTSLGFADGLVVFLNSGITFRTSADRIVRSFVTGQSLTGTNWLAQLYYGAAPWDLHPSSDPPAHFPATSGGRWITSYGDRVLHGFNPGETVWLQVNVWDVTLFPTYEAAVAGGGGGALPPFPYTIPLPGAGVQSYYMENFRPNPSLNELVLPSLFPPARVGNDIVITWRPRPDRALYQTIGTSPLHWQPVSPAPTNGIFQTPMTGEVVLFGLGSNPTPP